MRRLATLILVLVMFGSTSSTNVAHAEGNDGDVSVTETEQGKWRGRARLAVDRRAPVRAPDRPRTPRAGSEGSRAIVAQPRLTKAQWSAFLEMCRQTYGDSGCRDISPASRESVARLVADLDATARTLIAKLQLPDPTPQIGPDPARNEWKMAAVGYPLWLWTGGPRTITSRVRAFGVTFTLRATWLSTDFDMGDGHQVRCTETSTYPAQSEPGRKSPSCGYTYLESSLPKGEYTVRATTNWRISWSALGRSGSVPGSYTGSRSLPVGELNALVVR